MKWAVVSIFILSVLYVHFRGKARLPFFRQIFDHSSIMAPLNIFMYMFSKVPTNTPYLPTSTFADLKILEDNWETIRDEAQGLIGLEKIRAAEKNDDAGFNSFFKAGWKRFYLKWYDASHPSAEQFCPKTVALLRRTPSVKAAMFAELAPGGTLNPLFQLSVPTLSPASQYSVSSSQTVFSSSNPPACSTVSTQTLGTFSTQ